MNAINFHAIRAIYHFEMARAARTKMQSIISPVISTALYFVVFGAAIGPRMQEVDGVSYGAFIVPGLIMLSLLTQSVSNASFGIYFPKFTGTIYEILSAPVSSLEVVIAYVGAAATKSAVLGLIILANAFFATVEFALVSARRTWLQQKAAQHVDRPVRRHGLHELATLRELERAHDVRVATSDGTGGGIGAALGPTDRRLR